MKVASLLLAVLLVAAGSRVKAESRGRGRGLGRGRGGGGKGHGGVHGDPLFSGALVMPWLLYDTTPCSVRLLQHRVSCMLVLCRLVAATCAKVGSLKQEGL